MLVVVALIRERRSEANGSEGRENLGKRDDGVKRRGVCER